jgi:hypothetical protein
MHLYRFTVRNKYWSINITKINFILNHSIFLNGFLDFTIDKIDLIANSLIRIVYGKSKI